MINMDKIDEYFDKALIEKKGTKSILRSHIQIFFRVIDKDMDTYFDEKQDYEENLRLYWKHIQGKAPNTQIVAISSVKGFLRRFDKQTRDLDIWDDISARLRGKSTVTEEYVPDIDEIKQILNYCDIRTKAVIMVALSSGMRIGEIVQLLPSDVHFDETPTRINVRPEIAKNDKMRTTFITPETTDMLKEWLRKRDEYTNKSMKRLNFKNMKHYKYETKKQQRKEIFPYSPHRIREAFNKACENAGFTSTTVMKGDYDLPDMYKKDHKHHRERRQLRFHNLRKFFRTYFGNSDLAEHIMGHSGYLSQYRNYNNKQLAKEYMKYINNVTIYERPADLTDVNKELAEKDKQIQELLEFKKLMELKIQGLENKLEIEKIKNGNK
jgi:integrase